jgi:hypothetical protein
MFIHTTDKTLQGDLPPTPPIPTQVVSMGVHPHAEEQGAAASRCAVGRVRRSLQAQARLDPTRVLQNRERMAAAMLAINKVFTDRFFDVQEVEAADEAAAMEARKSDDFIIDVQTHYIDDPQSCGTRPTRVETSCGHARRLAHQIGQEQQLAGSQ